jgi:hypothetical protein
VLRSLVARAGHHRAGKFIGLIIAFRDQRRCGALAAAIGNDLHAGAQAPVVIGADHDRLR